MSISSSISATFELYFPSLYLNKPALSFPCNAKGEVPMDELSERARDNYFCARTLMGRVYGSPSVILAAR